MERKRIIYLTFRRAAEMLIGCILPSVVICALYVSGVMPVESFQRDVTLIVAPIAFVVWNFSLLRRCYVAFAGERIYYIANILSYLIFALINACTYIFLTADTYTWIFIVTRLGRYTGLGISSPVAIAMFHCIVCASIFAAHIGLGWVKEVRKEEKEFLEKISGEFDLSKFEQTYSNAEMFVNEIKE